jgi:hypothetical protein
MAKKIMKVVVQEAYYNLLVQKAELLDKILGEADRATIESSDFKDYSKIEKGLEKVDVEVEEYEPPADD